MDKRELYEDISFILFIVPFALPTFYAIYLWIANGLSLFLPEGVYLTVTRDPIIFMIGVFSIIFASYIELMVEEVSKRGEAILRLSKRLQKIAALSFILAVLTSLYSNSFDLAGMVFDILAGRYTLVFPLILFFMSYLMVAPINIASIANMKFLAILLLLLVPFVLLIGRAHTSISLLASLILMIIAAIIFIYSEREMKL